MLIFPFHLLALPPAQIIIPCIAMQEGTNTINVQGNKGTITLLKKGIVFSNVIYTNTTGNTFRLMPGPCEKVACAFPVPYACFGNEQTARIIICRDGNRSDSRIFTLTLLLPAK